MSDSARQLTVIDALTDDVYRNLALEEWLFRDCPLDEVRLLFYVHGPAVVIGRNQNPWTELDIAQARRRSVPLARRVSGGGTVYHDTGNLNYSFIMPRALYDPRRFLRLITSALAKIGIASAACDRSSVWIGSSKISGTAFTLTGKRAMLHGCILVNSDLEALRGLLQVPVRRIETKAVESVRSPVTSLHLMRPAITREQIIQAVAEVAAADLRPASVARQSCPTPTPDALRPFLEKQHAWDWIFGRTAAFEHRLVPSEGRPVCLKIRHGRIAATTMEGPAGDGTDLDRLLVGLPYDGPTLARALTDTVRHTPALRPLISTLLEEIPDVGAELGLGVPGIEPRAELGLGVPGA